MSDELASAPLTGADLLARLNTPTPRIGDDDLHTLCFSLGRRYEEFGGPHTPTPRRLENLIQDYASREALGELVAAIRRHRPDIALPDVLSFAPSGNYRVPDEKTSEKGGVSPGDVIRARRCAALAARIEEAWKLINEFEDVRLLSSDPRERRRAELAISGLREDLERFEKEYRDLKTGDGQEHLR